MNQIIDYFSNNMTSYLQYVVEHLELSLISLVMAILIGLPLGMATYKHKGLSEWIISTSQLLRIIPSLALLFFLIPILGVGKLPAIIALVFLAIPPIVVNTILGFNEVPASSKEVALGMGMTSRQLFRRIEFPLALPYLLNGIKLALVEIIASATLAVYIGAGGLGTLIMTGLGLYRMDLLLIGGLSVAILSLSTMLLGDFIIGKVLKNRVQSSY
ncbi:ABC transporter permease [Granulicatella seriolae]|uniref:ABC transporter permease n=1 Tax=Granulicatella seriolae TaxID=2967226 RepID=A0ABT1WML3_9LACT|nr:ABC transporter permease [Granulicatella seriolae]